MSKEGNLSFTIKCTKTSPIDKEEHPPELIFYIGYCFILKSLLDLTKRDAEVLANIMYHNYLYKDNMQVEEMRWFFIFSKSVRERMRSFVNMSYNNFNNSLTNLRIKKILVSFPDSSIERIKSEFIVFPLDNKASITINFNIDNESSR